MSSPAEEERVVKLVLVEDHLALRKGMELLLGRHGCVIVGAASNAEDGYELITRTRPDVAVVDVNLGAESGIDLTRRLLESDPDLGILLYTGAEDPATLAEALDCGARGFALKSVDPDQLRAAITTVAEGGSYVDPGLRPKLLARATTERIGILSGREREVLDHLARGMTGEQIAKHLFLSPETIRTHVRNAMDKLEAQTRTHAIAIALREGEISS